MARIQGVTRGGPLVRIAYAVARRRFGQVPEPLTLWAHSPRLMLGIARFERSVEGWTAVDPVTRSLTVLRSAQVIDCPWCLDFGSSLAQADGVTPQQLEELATWETSTAFTPLQRAAFAYAEAATRTPMEVTDAHVEALRSHLTEAGVVELAMLVALENQRSRFNHGLGVTAQGYCRVPPASPPGTAASAG